MILSVMPAVSVILSARAESMTFSAGGAKQLSTKSCSGKRGDNGGGRGNSGGGGRFNIGSGNKDCSDNSNGNGNVDGVSGNGDSNNDNRAESILLSVGGAIIPSKSHSVAVFVCLHHCGYGR
jgi:hypothetical protein